MILPPEVKASRTHFSTGRKRGRTDLITMSLIERQHREQTVIDLVLNAGFVSIGKTEDRIVTADDGTSVTLKGRKRFENCNRVRVTIGLHQTFFYTVGAEGQPNPIASHPTLDFKAIKRTVDKLN